MIPTRHQMEGIHTYKRIKEQKPIFNRLSPAAKSYEPWTWSAMPQTSSPVWHKDSSAQNTHTVEKSQQCILGSGQETHGKTTETYGATKYGDTWHQTHYLPVNNEQPASVDQPHLHSAPIQGDLCTIMHKQNEITVALVQQHAYCPYHLETFQYSTVILSITETSSELLSMEWNQRLTELTVFTFWGSLPKVNPENW